MLVSPWVRIVRVRGHWLRLKKWCSRSSTLQCVFVARSVQREKQESWRLAQIPAFPSPAITARELGKVTDLGAQSERPDDPGTVGAVLPRSPIIESNQAHAGLDELERNGAPHRLCLPGHVDRAHATLAHRLQELVRADDRAGAFRG